MDAKDLKTEIEDRIIQLANLTAAAAISTEVKNYLDICSKFYNYSPYNQLLIMFEFPNASRVAGFNAWKSFGRFVKRGEHGIPILAPMLYPKDPDDENSPKIIKGFKVVYVFDISQTDGNPLPEIDWSDTSKLDSLNEKLFKFAEKKSISVSIVDQPGTAQGSSHNGRIEIAPMAGTSTLIHELAHELLNHHTNHTDRSTAEAEAESIAYVVSSYFGVPDTKAPNYLALWDADSTTILSRFENIQRVSCEIITAIEKGG